MFDRECTNHTAYFDHQRYQEWQNYSPFHNQSKDLHIYVCAMAHFNDLVGHMRLVQGSLNVFSGLVGLIGSVLTLFTLLRNQKFTQHSFFYFRYVAVLETVDSVVIFWCHGMSWILHSIRIRSFTWSYIFGVGVSIGNFVTLCVDLITVQVSIERAVACLFPSKFHFLDRPKVVYWTCAGTFIFALILNAAAPFSYKVIKNRGSETYSVRFVEAFVGLSKVTEIVGYMVSVAVAVSCALAVIGLLKFLKIRKSLIHPQHIRDSSATGNRHVSTVQARKDEKLRLNLQLCYLTISQAVPAVINNAIYAVYIVKYDRYFPVGLSAILEGLTFQDAMENLRLSYAQRYLSFFTHITNDLAHCFHFYLYVTFSKRFRQGFVERMKQIWS